MQNISPDSITVTFRQGDRIMWADIAWDPIPSSDFNYYELRWKKKNDTGYQSRNVFDEPRASVQVEENTEYVFRIRGVGNDPQNKTPFSGPVETVGVTSPLLNLSISRSRSVSTIDTNQSVIIVQDWQLSGTVTAVSGTATVAGTSTYFRKQLLTGQNIKFDDNIYTILSIESDTSLILTSNSLTDSTDVNYYLADQVIMRGNLYLGQNADAVIFPDTGWKIFDDNLGAPQVLRFDNNALMYDDQSRGMWLEGTFSQSALRVIGGTTDEQKTLRLMAGSFTGVDFGDNSIYERDGYLYVNKSGKPDAFLSVIPIFEEDETYYRYDKIGFKNYDDREVYIFDHKDTTITEKNHSSPSGQLQKLWDITEVTQFGNKIRYELSAARALSVTSSTTISFTDLSGITITDHIGSCTLPVVSGNNVTFSDTGTLTAFKFSNGQWVVTELQTGTTAYNVGDINGSVTLGNGTIASGAWTLSDLYSYTLNYGCNNSYIPAKLDGSECADGSAITKPPIYGDNGFDGTIIEYNLMMGVYKDATSSRSLTGGSTYSLDITPSGTGSLLEEYPHGLNFWNSTTMQCELPNGNHIYDIRYTFIFNTSVATSFVRVQAQINGGSNYIIYEMSHYCKINTDVTCTSAFPVYVSDEMAQYGLKIRIIPENNGTISSEGIAIFKR